MHFESAEETSGDLYLKSSLSKITCNKQIQLTPYYACKKVRQLS
jgi:hypothetical protein